MDIQKHLPIPDKPRPSGRPSRYPFSKMEIGDSAFVPMDEGEIIQLTRHRVANSARHAFGPGNYTARTVDEPERGIGVRVWRTG